MDFMLIYELLVPLAGFFGLYLCWKTKRSGKVADLGPVLPTGIEPHECSDPKAFIDRTVPPLIVLSVVAILEIIPPLLSVAGFHVPTSIVLIGIGIFLASAVYFVVVQRKAIFKYWA